MKARLDIWGKRFLQSAAVYASQGRQFVRGQLRVHPTNVPRAGGRKKAQAMAKKFKLTHYQIFHFGHSACALNLPARSDPDHDTDQHTETTAPRPRPQNARVPAHASKIPCISATAPTWRPQRGSQCHSQLRV